jgi:uncharacterized protein (TIGR03437 family)
VSKTATARILIATVLAAAGLRAQLRPDWRHIGNSLIDQSLAGLATGPVARAWYSGDGSRLLIRTASGRLYETADFETWRAATADATAEPPAAVQPALARLPENGAQVRSQTRPSPRIYSFGKFAYRSDDGGASWDNLTAFRASSILGDNLRDLAISPANPDDIVVAGDAGVFRSLDGGKSWSSLNQGLANLPVDRILGLPAGDRGVQLALADQQAVEWQPGEKRAWTPVDNTALLDEARLRQALSSFRGAQVTAIAVAGDFVYTGMADGQISVSADGGRTWRSFSVNEGGPVARFWVDPNDSRVALAVLGSRSRDIASPAPAVHVMRSLNGGAFWDDLTLNLPDVPANGIATDRASGAVYVATSQGVYMTYAELGSLGGIQPWSPLGGLAQASVKDVKLDAQGNQLWAAVDGFGVYSTLAPHRLRDPRVVSAADFVARAAAPGSLVSVLGARVQAARAGDLAAPVLAASDGESQLQIPFEARGPSVSLAVDAASGRLVLPSLPLEPAAPAIFVDRDGSPMLLESESGVMLDAMRPAHSNARIQILATGLGRVIPDWPTGLAAPLENPPRVAGSVRAYLDRTPVDVTRAVLAPGYIGFYLVEIEVPKIVNYGPAELYLEVEGQGSNRVRIYIEP